MTTQHESMDMDDTGAERSRSIAVIGCGGRIRGLLALDKRIRVVAVADPHPASIQAAREAFGEGIRVYDDHRAMLREGDDFDWVAVGSWNCFHREHAVDALEAGKHVFCEKPLATTREDCLAIREAVATSGRMFFFGLVLRYSPFYQKIHELVRAGRIGRLVSFEFNEHINFFHGCYIMGGWRARRRYAGTHMLEKCCHDLDISLWLTESEPVRVASFGGLNLFTPENRHLTVKDADGVDVHTQWDVVGLEHPFDSEKDIVDNQVVILEYANGVRATFHANCAAGIPERRMLLMGTEGAIRADAHTGQIELQRIHSTPQMERHDIDLNGGSAAGHAGGDAVLMEALYRSMAEGAQPLVGVDEGIRSAEMSFAIDRAMDSGEVVRLA